MQVKYTVSEFLSAKGSFSNIDTTLLQFNLESYWPSGFAVLVRVLVERKPVWMLQSSMIKKRENIWV